MIKPRVELRSAREIFRRRFVAEKSSGEGGDRAAAVRKNVADIRSPVRGAAGDETHNGAAHVGVVLDRRLRHAGNETASAAPWRGAVRIDDRFAAIEFIEDGLER